MSRYAWTPMTAEERSNHQLKVSWESCAFQDFIVREWNPVEIGWLAGILDGEGNFAIVRRRAGKKNGGGRIQRLEHYSTQLTVASIDPVMAQRCQEITGVGRLQTRTFGPARWKKLYAWAASGWDARAVALLVYDALVVKRNQADLVLGELNEDTWSRLRAIHGRGEPRRFEGGDDFGTA